ncbi:MAG: ribonuclease P protein component [Burkholderiales bacterium RIFCSPLOWO2_12_FULL_65_40]|nr:MAG: ribonuclease P protein component [Burkholderiales bacterium RIFCSPLOWO2_12_FULL_65_40]
MQRLKTRPQFQATMAGETVARTAHFALHRLVLGASECAPASERPGAQALFSGPDIWLGAMVPKRWARRAVTRNAIKRQIYGVAAALEPTLPPAAHVVRLRATFDRKQFVSASSDPLKQAVRAELQQLFERALGARKPASAPGAA